MASHRTSEEELNELHVFKRFAEASTQGFGMATLDGMIVYTNPALLRMLGVVSLQEIKGKSFMEFYPDRCQKQLQSEVVPTALEHGEWKGELELIGADSISFPTLETYFLIRDESGQPLYLADVIIDITDTKQVEAELAESRRIFQTVADYTYDWETWMTPEGRYIYVSPSCKRITGYPPEFFLEDSENIVAITHPEDQEAHRREIAEALSQKRDMSFEFRIVPHSGGVRWIELKSQPVIFEDGSYHGRRASFRDVTDRKEIAFKLAQSNRELEHFAYVVSHDLQEPLRMVTSYLQLLERRTTELDEDSKEFIWYAVDGAARMQQMINDLLTYSRVKSKGKPFQESDLDGVLEDALANLKVAIEESQAAIEVDSQLPRVLADRSQMVRLFQNLIGNAVKFRGESAPQVELGVRDQEGDWLFSISDNGIGIPRSQQERIFQVFQQLHGRGEYPGTGIGLAVCRRIVERHGGRIWVESEEGQGSTFFFTLPKREEKDDSASPSATR